eukprot:2513718-Heterocapsa_arctica.AAC.1
MDGAGVGPWRAETSLTEGGASQLLRQRSGGGFMPLLRVVDVSYVPALVAMGPLVHRIIPLRLSLIHI